VDNEGRDVPAGEPGEVIAQGPHMMLGYWNRPEATAETIVDGWLHTGDVGRFDDDGYLYIVDRKKDMIISGGSNIYAREVEEAMLRCRGIKEAAVIGLPHPKWGEMVTAVLVAEGGAPLPQAELEAFCRREIADYRRPKQFFWVDALPRNAYGKVLKRELRQRLNASTPA
jgi:acyl-CoA synthetase (AMP-forming)/AMP-acid ligase II